MSKQPFDPAAFLAAAEKAAAVTVYPVDLPTVGRCWVRPLTFGDEMASHAARETLEAQGVALGRKELAAMRLAQNLCGPEGEPIFDPADAGHLKILANLPTEAVADALRKAAEADGLGVPKA